MTVNWSSQNGGVGFAGDYIAWTDCAEIAKASNFRNYKITYCKMKMVLSDSTTTGRRWDDIHIASDMQKSENWDNASYTDM